MGRIAMLGTSRPHRGNPQVTTSICWCRSDNGLCWHRWYRSGRLRGRAGSDASSTVCHWLEPVGGQTLGKT